MNHTYIQAIQRLVAGGSQAHVDLADGWKLAYTPAETRKAADRLVLSQRDIYPSDEQTGQLDEALRLVLRRLSRENGLVVVSGPNLEPYQTIGRYGCTIATWRVVTSAELFSLRNGEARRSAMWLRELRELSELDKQLWAQLAREVEVLNGVKE